MEPLESMLARFALREHACRCFVKESAAAAGRTPRIALVMQRAAAGEPSRFGVCSPARQGSARGCATKH
jgi:hypothetical protein